MTCDTDDLWYRWPVIQTVLYRRYCTDGIIDQLLGKTTNEIADEEAEAVPIEQQNKRERLVAPTAGGQTELYLG